MFHATAQFTPNAAAGNAGASAAAQGGPRQKGNPQQTPDG
jgi:hypothetical protein